ncbi:alcohol dehydrogenase catalytic domain-containing protein [Streptomyces coelicoflavus]|uniref:2-deoxy-scyllo-inosamine dehydrogenase n=1 Tax=Streptomyces coelicoflavus TaxID=285562 RepID=A0A7K3PVK1_9ACTN|nr:alcohol dehydrogenase catalytic domain-containing protein [Streptomyces coelicoflavus]NEB14014.1 alcohol dehydrogenase catalytic domain-containing protein [Streptomyces coelicoflavus]
MVVTEPDGPLVASAVENAPLDGQQVRVSVRASGVCHADIGTARASKAGPDAPVTPGHEVAGVVTEVGDRVRGWTVGDRVAVGWLAW